MVVKRCQRFGLQAYRQHFLGLRPLHQHFLATDASWRHLQSLMTSAGLTFWKAIGCFSVMRSRANRATMFATTLYSKAQWQSQSELCGGVSRCLLRTAWPRFLCCSILLLWIAHSLYWAQLQPSSLHWTRRGHCHLYWLRFEFTGCFTGLCLNQATSLFSTSWWIDLTFWPLPLLRCRNCWIYLRAGASSCFSD